MKLDFDSRILNTLGDKLFKTKIWKNWVKQFSLQASEVSSDTRTAVDPSKILFRSLEDEGYEITTRQILIDK